MICLIILANHDRRVNPSHHDAGQRCRGTSRRCPALASYRGSSPGRRPALFRYLDIRSAIRNTPPPTVVCPVRAFFPRVPRAAPALHRRVTWGPGSTIQRSH